MDKPRFFYREEDGMNYQLIKRDEATAELYSENCETVFVPIAELEKMEEIPGPWKKGLKPFDFDLDEEPDPDPIDPGSLGGDGIAMIYGIGAVI